MHWRELLKRAIHVAFAIFMLGMAIIALLFSLSGLESSMFGALHGGIALACVLLVLANLLTEKERPFLIWLACLLTLVLPWTAAQVFATDAGEGAVMLAFVLPAWLAPPLGLAAALSGRGDIRMRCGWCKQPLPPGKRLARSVRRRDVEYVTDSGCCTACGQAVADSERWLSRDGVAE